MISCHWGRIPSGTRANLLCFQPLRRLALGALLTLAVVLPARAELKEYPSSLQVAPASEALDATRVAELAIGIAIRDRLASGLPLDGLAADLPALQAFYAARDYAPVWLGATGLHPSGAALLSTLAMLDKDGFVPTGPWLAAIATRQLRATDPARAELDLLLSAALVQFAVAADDPESTGPQPNALAAVADSDDQLPLWVPFDPRFWRLRTGVAAYEGIAARGGWLAVPQGAKLELGMRDARVALLRQRLLVTGELGEIGVDPELFDEALRDAVSEFQTRHGLLADGVVGFGTIDALNVTVDDRLATMRLNLARLQQQPRTWGEDYIVVNIPAADMVLVQGGVTTMATKVIVGRGDRQTPEIHSAINRLEFNPYWTVPSGIYRKDILPKARKDPGYLLSHNIRVFTSWTERASEVDPRSVNWYGEDASKMRLRLRQDPGPDNALGPAKFLFPNSYDVYLHGTNKQSLFGSAERFLSSGCVRVPDPLGLAAQILKDSPDWNRARIDEAVKDGRNQGVRLDAPLPVHLIYDTAWVDETGIVQFRKDIYRRDRKALAEIAERGKKS
jgi:L,D-transpeptidase YcbB